MAFKTINGVVRKTPNKERTYSRIELVKTHPSFNNRSHLVIARITKGEKEGQTKVESYKAAEKAGHEILRFAVKEELTFLYR